MIGVILCAVAFLAALRAGYRSLVAGLVVVLVAGYAYGITRANVTDIGGYFFFDAAIVGFFLARLSVGRTTEQRARIGYSSRGALRRPARDVSDWPDSVWPAFRTVPGIATDHLFHIGR